MRVMCISHEDFSNGGSWEGPVPPIGGVFEVKRECIGYGTDGEETSCYELVGFNDEDDFVYDQRNFATLPEPTATEMYEVEIEGILF